MDRVSYEQIQKANDQIKTMKVGSKDYAKVSERVKAFRQVYPTGTIETSIEDVKEDYVRILAIIKDENQKIISTGRASEVKEAKGKMNINLTSLIENCETSAVGRALGFAGFGIENEIASGEDVKNAKSKNKAFEIYDKIYISEEDAVYTIKLSVFDLMRKMGVIKAELNEMVNKELWTSLGDMNSYQLLQLEIILKTLNSPTNKWHHLYNQNSRIKDVVEPNQRVVYVSSWERFGKIALKQAGTNELLVNEIIDHYLEIGIDLRGDEND